jgi:hypothetical protein
MSFLPGMFPAIAIAASPPATCTLTDSSYNASDASTQTFASQSFGAATSSDKIIVVISARATNPRTINSVTVDGVAATAVAFVDMAYGGNDNCSAIYIANATGNATGTVEVVWSATVLRCGIGVFVASKLQSSVATATATDTGANPSVSIDIHKGGIALAGVIGSDDVFSWTGLDWKYEEVMESGTEHSGASREFADAQTAYSISNNKSDVATAFTAASFR